MIYRQTDITNQTQPTRTERMRAKWVRAGTAKRMQRKLIHFTRSCAPNGNINLDVDFFLSTELRLRVTFVRNLWHEMGRDASRVSGQAHRTSEVNKLRFYQIQSACFEPGKCNNLCLHMKIAAFDANRVRCALCGVSASANCVSFHHFIHRE